ncbi:MAG: UvrB/UvrC motif-containing protein [Candidatus Saccharimonadales bacterium]
MLWVNFMHIYQPLTQKPYWVNRVTEESYRPLFQGFLKNPDLKSTININSVLVELLEENGHQDVIEAIHELLKRGQIELTGSAKFHPLMVYTPDYERRRQIELNDVSLRKYFGDYYQPRGFFPPEMAFDMDVAKTAKECGFEWIIVDELSFPGQAQPDHKQRYSVEGVDGLDIYFRERSSSWNILSGQIGTPDLLRKMLGARTADGSYLLTAMDGETFGHHRPGLQSLIFDLNQADELQTVLLSDLKDYFPDTKKVVPQASTWALMEKDLERKVPFSRWKDPDNEIHDIQWELTNHLIKLYEPVHIDQTPVKEDALDRALQSDQFWWASARPWWSIEMMERAAKNLYEAAKMAPEVKDADISKAEALYHKIIFTAFDWQRSGKVDEMARQEDEDIRQRTDQDIPKLPKEEVDKMIANLRKEMAQVAGKEEFERAAQIRDRIRELKEYADENIDIPRASQEGSQEWDVV